MSGSGDKLFETAVRPLGDDAEMRLAAISLLERVSPQGADGAEGVIRRWDAVDAGRRKLWWRWLFVVVLLVFSVWVWAVAAREVLAYVRLDSVSPMHRWDNDPDYAESVAALDKSLPPNLDRDQRMLLLGDPARSTRVEAMRSLWESAPEEPALHMEYVISRYESSFKAALDPDFLETARRLDPGNAWPVYLAGSFSSNGAIKAKRQSAKELTDKVPATWEIRDQGKLDRSMALFHEASREPRMDTYQEQMRAKRKGLIPVEDHLGYLTAAKVSWFAYWGNQSPDVYLTVYPHLAAAKSQQLAADGDKEGFVQLMADLEILNRRWLEHGIASVGPELSFSESKRRAVPRLHASAIALDLPAEAARLESMMKPQPKVPGEGAGSPDGYYDWMVTRAPTLLSTFGPSFTEIWHPPWTLEETKPGRMADHELLARGCSLVLWLFFGVVLAGLAFYQLRVPRLIRRMAGRVGQLLDAGDHLRIIGGGVILPYLLVMAVNQLTPFGGRDWSIIGNLYLLPASHFLSLAVLMVVLPVIILRRRLAVKAGVLGLTGARPFWLCLAAVYAAVLVPGIGWFAHSEWNAGCVPLVGCLVALLLVLGLVKLCAGWFFSGELRLLRGAVASRALVPAYVTAMLLMAVAATVHKGAERAWFRRDTTMTSVPGFPGVSPYDYRVAERIRRDIREMPPLE